jgi:hypothetical protein
MYITRRLNDQKEKIERRPDIVQSSCSQGYKKQASRCAG